MDIAEEFAGGAIRWLKLRNFMTYGSFECHFGPTLNLFIAPNGTGKSAIVNAICLVLGGSPKFLGRADKLSSYVRTGCETGEIEIGLIVSEKEKVMCIKRVLKFSSESTTWYLNERVTSAEIIVGLVRRSGIQVENLCQFLPQDRTADFARMNNIERLRCVEATVGSAAMQNYRDELVKKAADLNSVSRSLEQRESELTELRTRDNAFRADVENAKARDANELKLKWTERKRCYVDVQRRRNEFQTKQSDLKRVKDRIASEKASCMAFEQRMGGLRDSLAQSERLAKARLAELSNARRSLADENEAGANDLEKASELEASLARKRDAARKHNEKLHELEEHLEACRATLRSYEQEYRDELADPNKLDERVRSLQAERAACSRSLNETIAQLDTNRHELRAVGAELNAAQHELRATKSAGEQRLAALDTFGPKGRDARDAVLWLRANRSRFRGEIHEPIALLLSVTDSRDAKFVEQLIPFKELLIFLFQYDEDLEIFSREVVDRQHKSVNLAKMVSESDAFAAPYNINEISRFGFEKWVRECCVAPASVIAYLCRQCNIHQVPIGTERTMAAGIHERITRELPQITRYFTPSSSFSIRRSRYSGDVSTQVATIREPRILKDARDADRELKLEQVIDKHSKRRLSLEQAVQQLDRSKTELEHKSDTLREKIKRLSQVRGNKTKQEEQIRAFEEQLESMQESPFDLRAEERRTKEEMRATYNAVLERLSRQNSALSVAQQGVLHHYAVAGVEAHSSTALFRGMERRIREHRDTIEAQHREQEALKRACLESKRVQDEAYRRFTAMIPEGQLDDNAKRMMDSYPDDIDELDEKIAQLRALIQCASLSGDRQAIADAKKRAERIARLTEEIAHDRPRKDELATQVQDLRSKWLDPLNTIIERVDRKFAGFCKRLAARGSVRLVPPAPANATNATATVTPSAPDYERYELQIRCAFREGHELQELNGGTQSGGERSVATILFMLSLQQLTRVPFRCIDEINQGMDPVNERRVFDLVVQTACRDVKSQYFMFTPKLLPKLRYSDRMNVIVIYNGKRAVQKADTWLDRLLGGNVSICTPNRSQSLASPSLGVSVSNSSANAGTPSATRKRPASPPPSESKRRRF